MKQFLVMGEIVMFDWILLFVVVVLYARTWFQFDQLRNRQTSLGGKHIPKYRELQDAINQFEIRLGDLEGNALSQKLAELKLEGR